MQCPKCQSDNPYAQSYRSDCGTKLGPQKKDVPVHTNTLETPFEAVNQGTVFAGRYEILEKIGEGGMGEVYHAVTGTSIRDRNDPHPEMVRGA